MEMLTGIWPSLVAHMVKNVPAVRETQVLSLGLADSLEKGMATHSSILAWRIPWTDESGRLQSMVFDCVDYNKLWERDKNTRPPYLLPEKSVCRSGISRTGHQTTDWFQIGKGTHQGCILSPCLFNLYAEYIMRNAGLDEAQAGIKFAGRNISHLRYADDTTLWQKVKRN